MKNRPNLASGRDYLAIPGPSVMPERVLREMHRAAPNIYEGELVDMVPGLLDGLRSVARTRHHVAIYIGNGHAGWEASLANVLSRGDRVLVLHTGRFSVGWSEMAERLGAEVEMLSFGTRGPVDTARLAEVLAADTGHAYKAVLTVQVDTSTSVRNDIAAIRRTLDAAGHPALLMVDSIACLCCDVMEMDAWGVDVVVTGSQKGLMTPPGLAFVFFNDRADAARDHADCVTHYWDWRPRVSPRLFPNYFDGTAPTHHLYGLRAALGMIAEEGIEAIWARHEALARAVWAAVETWGQGGPLELNIPDPAHRSHAVTTILAGETRGAELRATVERMTGLTLGLGIGMGEPTDRASDAYFRIGHMGHVNAHMIMGALGAIEIGLRGAGIPFAPGGLDAAAGVLAEAAGG
ncbi:pyridoxal-phosphate-dependent aminotransferase family protein [Ovoidimarina sediminis]|uniref:pyridoxal-phosphate-dependent aminotransferase family protein n=1 Tax=Ovoidimarina sediminis TaxID=3079856 RepID=UPI00290B50B9|nr:aminotransferase class V-fold PLP-dependent enzyme [Rhodophyticola sp. MJ-SS7]MDU8944933.1 aminotransferase class V-fold PLP-dependent enzyme [Rhodophyticola sp. MJ-SS7]